jgi:hypothetical protein
MLATWVSLVVGDSRFFLQTKRIKGQKTKNLKRVSHLFFTI